MVHAFNSVNTLTNVHQQLFARCPTENTTIGQSPDTLLALSELQCVRECSESDGCEGVVVCPFGEAGHVRCRFDWGGVTYPLSRRVRDTSWSSVTWTQAKDGLGDDLAVAPDSRNYFVGLDKLYQLLSQGSYVGLIASSYSTSFIGISAFFFNFTVGPESSGYRLTYDSFSTNAIKPALNGLNASSPLLFSASGNDGNGCAEVRGAPGWYGSDCSGHSMFADPPTWPVPDQGTPVLNAIELALTRS
ncbi:uncharacterized protein [Littorina saxatilis]|uniref:uncharacterized protein n=1 Tax=Littorina saxatilis TaxID=31220 RepID=UPI0038B4A7D4